MKTPNPFVVVYGKTYLEGPLKGQTVEGVISFRTEEQARACHRELVGRIGKEGKDALTLCRHRLAYARVMETKQSTDDYIRRLHNQAE
jgi:hypothetical protein